MSRPTDATLTSSEPAPGAEARGRKKGKILLKSQQEAAVLNGEDDTLPTFDVKYGGGKGLGVFAKNPFVPIGAFTTAAILMGGLMAFRAGNARLSQRMMQARIIAQGATLGVLSFSVARVHYGNGDAPEEQAPEAAGIADAISANALAGVKLAASDVSNFVEGGSA